MEPEILPEFKSGAESQPPTLLPDAPKRSKGLERLLAAWKVFIYLFLGVQVIPTAVFVLGSRVFGPQARGSFTPQFLLFLEVGNFALTVGLTLLISLFERRPFGGYGLPLKGAFRTNFWIGFLLGLLEASVLIGIVQIFGGYSFGSWALHGAEALRWGALHLLLFAFVGLLEEFLFRGYAQYTLSRIMGFWPTAILLSVGFGLVHLGNRGENWVGASSVVVVGLLFALTLKRTGNLWYAVGMHSGFDWAQSFLYSVPDSGELLKGHLSNAVLQGPNWLTGGSVGPEGSVFCFLTLGLQFFVVMWLFPAKKSEIALDEAAGQK